MRFRIPFLFVVLLIGLISQPAKADVVMQLTEVGDDVQVSASGSIDLASTIGFDGVVDIGSIQFNAREDADGTFTGVLGSVMDSYLHSGLTVTGDWVPQAFQAGLIGDPSMGMFANESNKFSNIYVPVGYVSGSALNFNATIVGQSFASLGFSDGDVGSVSWSNSAAGAESLTMRWGNVPEPGSASVLAIAALFAVIRRRK